MAIPSVENQEYPSPEEMLSQLLSDIRYGYARSGITVNVSSGSELFIRCKAIATRLSIAVQNNRLSLVDISPLDAEDDALTKLAGIFGVTRRPASSGAGLVQVTVFGGGTVVIPSGFGITSPDGLVYETTQANTVATLGFVEVQSTSTGSTTDQDPGTILTWDSAAIGSLGQNATVAGGGIDGGRNADDDDALRNRLLQRLGFPEVGGNTSQIISFAEAATAAVEQAFVYSSVRGPASYDVAVTAAGGDRTLSNANVNLVASNILANMPGTADLNATSVLAQLIDVVLLADLPLPVNAGGAGGGWRDAVPWPSDAEAIAGEQARVINISDLLTLSQIDVDSTNSDPPKIGDRFGIWNPAGGSDATGAMNEFSILGVTAIAGGFTITIDTAQSDAISFITTGMYCSAGALNLKQYASDFLDQMKLLGPGEKTDNPDILPRGRRRPIIDIEFPRKLTNVQISNVLEKHDEVLNLEYKRRFASGTQTVLTTPSIPLTTADPPRILVLQNLAIKAQRG